MKYCVLHYGIRCQENWAAFLSLCMVCMMFTRSLHIPVLLSAGGFPAPYGHCKVSCLENTLSYLNERKCMSIKALTYRGCLVDHSPQLILARLDTYILFFSSLVTTFHHSSTKK